MDDRFGLPFDDDPPDPEPRAAPAPAGAPPLTVTALTARLKGHVERAFGQVIVEGEVSNCRSWSSGHIYFTLKDDHAQLRAVLFRMQARLLRFALEDGLHVIARGRISLYEVKGEYQLVCDGVEPHGLGARQAAFDQLKRRLHAEGLFAAERKRPLPLLPRRIGVVTSLDGAALRDVLRVLASRHPTASVVIRAARVQGDGAAFDLVRALAAIARVPEVDVIIIGRGGGSAEDLWAFNDERLARAIAACPVPVIAAVGHEIDVTIADFVADVRAATPSNAAEIVVERADHVCARIDRARERLRAAASLATHRRAAVLDRWDTRLRGWPVAVVLRDRDTSKLTLRLRHGAANRIGRLGQRFEALRRRLERADRRRVLADLGARLTGAEGRLRAAVRMRQASADARARELAAHLDALSPLGVLARGYAVCWNADRTSIIRSAAGVRPGDNVRVTLAEGELACRVEKS